MSLYNFDSDLEKLKASWQETRLESLQLQKKFLLALQSRQLFWAKDADNTEIARTHTEIANLIQEILQRYEHILEMYYRGGK